MPRFESIIFYQKSAKIQLFLPKNAKFWSAQGSTPRPLCLRWLGALSPYPQFPAAGGFTPDAQWPSAAGGSDPRNPSIANFWLRAWF